MARRPDYSLAAMNKETGERNNKIGAAWKNSDGSLTIRIDPFVVLQGSSVLTLRLFPINADPHDDPTEEIPF